MKYIKLLISSLFVVTILSGMVGCDGLKEINTDKYYLKVPDKCTKKEDIYIEDNKTKKDILYSYNNVAAYDEDGKKVEVKFFANKKLRTNAYLRVSIKDPKDNEENEIIAYNEVKEDQLSSIVKEKLSSK